MKNLTLCLLLAAGAAYAVADPERPPDLGGRALLDLADDTVALPAGRALTPRFDPSLAPARKCEEAAGQIAWIGNEDDPAARGETRPRGSPRAAA